MTTTGDTKTTRKPKTPRQRAQETLARTDRRLKKATGEVGVLETKLAAARTQLADAQARRTYAAADPALKTTAGSTGIIPTGAPQ